jgi:hypothetical protein
LRANFGWEILLEGAGVGVAWGVTDDGAGSGFPRSSHASRS